MPENLQPCSAAAILPSSCVGVTRTSGLFIQLKSALDYDSVRERERDARSACARHEAYDRFRVRVCLCLKEDVCSVHLSREAGGRVIAIERIRRVVQQQDSSFQRHCFSTSDRRQPFEALAGRCLVLLLLCRALRLCACYLYCVRRTGWACLFSFRQNLRQRSRTEMSAY